MTGSSCSSPSSPTARRGKRRALRPDLVEVVFGIFGSSVERWWMFCEDFFDSSTALAWGLCEALAVYMSYELTDWADAGDVTQLFGMDMDFFFAFCFGVHNLRKMPTALWAHLHGWCWTVFCGLFCGFIWIRLGPSWLGAGFSFSFSLVAGDTTRWWHCSEALVSMWQRLLERPQEDSSASCGVERPKLFL